jgi:hypothetical protein
MPIVTQCGKRTRLGGSLMILLHTVDTYFQLSRWHRGYKIFKILNFVRFVLQCYGWDFTLYGAILRAL